MEENFGSKSSKKSKQSQKSKKSKSSNEIEVPYQNLKENSSINNESMINDKKIETEKKIDTNDILFQYGKMKIVNNLRFQVSLSIIFLGLTFFEYHDPFLIEVSIYKWILNAVINIFCILSVILYFYSINHRSRYLIITGMASKRISPIELEGKVTVIINCILFLISPLYGLTEYNLYTMESYWDGSTRLYYGREIYEYILVIMITIHFYVVMQMFVFNNFWGRPHVQRISNLIGIDHNPMFIIKSILIQYPQYFTYGLMIILMIYYSIILRILETGIQRSIKTSDFTILADYQAELVNYGNFDNYKNCIWNMFISMSTIGYGEMNVLATISRVIMFFIILSGLSSVSLMVVASSQFLEMEKLENFTLNLYDAIDLRDQMRVKAQKAMYHHFMMRKAAKMGSYIKYKMHRQTIESVVSDFRLLSNQYYSRYGNDEFDVLGILFVRIDDELDRILKICYQDQRIKDIYDDFLPSKQKAIGVLYNLKKKMLEKLEQNSQN